MDYYNEWCPFNVRWLKNLIGAGEIPQGVVDGRDVRQGFFTTNEPISSEVELLFQTKFRGGVVHTI